MFHVQPWARGQMKWILFQPVVSLSKIKRIQCINLTWGLSASGNPDERGSRGLSGAPDRGDRDGFRCEYTWPLQQIRLVLIQALLQRIVLPGKISRSPRFPLTPPSLATLHLMSQNPRWVISLDLPRYEYPLSRKKTN